MITDPVEIWGEVIGPVANDPFPDELSLAFKPKQCLVNMWPLHLKHFGTWYMNSVLIQEVSVIITHPQAGFGKKQLFQSFSPIWIFFVPWTGLLVIVKFHVLIQPLKMHRA